MAQIFPNLNFNFQLIQELDHFCLRENNFMFTVLVHIQSLIEILHEEWIELIFIHSWNIDSKSVLKESSNGSKISDFLSSDLYQNVFQM